MASSSVIDNRHPQRIFDYFDKYTFFCEMYEDHSDSIRYLVLNFYPFDNSVEILDVKKGTRMLRRVQMPSLTMEMLKIGNTVNIFSKLLLLTECVPATRKKIFHNFQRTFAMIKPTPASLHGKIITFIMKNGFRIVNMKNGKISKELAMEMYSHVSDNLPLIIDYVTSSEVIGLELEAPDAVRKWKQRLGGTDPTKAEEGTLRRLYGETTIRNVAHGCDTLEDAKRICEIFFGTVNGVSEVPYRATFKDCSCCIIKPHVLFDGNVGQIFEIIASSEDFYISAMAMFTVKLCDAQEFYEVYKGVLPEYEGMCIHLSEGSCIALEIKSKNPDVNVVCGFRKLCGPRDPDLCRQLYPDSIRALYGKDIIHNAVHCTDLPEDGEQEVEYFFKLLAIQ